MKSYTIAIVGATGAVGREILKLLESSTLPIAAIRCFASPSSFGKKIEFKGSTIKSKKYLKWLYWRYKCRLSLN